MSISVLPIHLVNKIAAGEVVERPASVVKELVENALDAGAGRIDVTIEDGGRRLISVTDDGAGLGRDDVALAFAPHATSKLAGEDDLFNIATLGFRGEALASIAAISHAHIRTRTRDDDSGYEIRVAGGQVDAVRPCSAAPGTTVTVRDLFFNTPARRKFLRTANTEAGHISEQIARLALPHPQVAFTLTNNGRQTQHLPATDSTRRRAGDLFTTDLAEALLEIVTRGGQTIARGLAGPPSLARSSGKWQYFFLNGRYIRDRLLSHALREAYRGLLAHNRFAVAFIFLEIPPDEVDVNVHPTKIEVRFRNGQSVHGEVLAALKETLNRANLAPQADLEAAHGAGDADGASEERRDSLRQALADFFKSTPPPQPRLAFPEGLRSVGPAGSPHAAATATSTPPKRPLPIPHPPHTIAPGATSEEPPADFAPPADTPADTPTAPPAPAPARIDTIQIHNSYIVAACEDGLEIVDQHALHERILYNELRNRLSRGPLAAQRLLIPETLAVTAAEADTLSQCRQLLGRLGIETAPFGPDTIAIHQFPLLLTERGVSAVDFIRELLDRLAEDETTDGERMLSGLLEMMACKAAVKAGDPLTPAEIDALLAKRRDAEKASACPHGRPTTLRLTLRDLEKQFKRT